MEDGIEEEQSVRAAGDREIVGGVVEPRNESGEGREMTTSRTTRGGDAVGIDAEFRCHAADEAKG